MLGDVDEPCSRLAGSLSWHCCCCQVRRTYPALGRRSSGASTTSVLSPTLPSATTALSDCVMPLCPGSLEFVRNIVPRGRLLQYTEPHTPNVLRITIVARRPQARSSEAVSWRCSRLGLISVPPPSRHEGVSMRSKAFQRLLESIDSLSMAQIERLSDALKAARAPRQAAATSFFTGAGGRPGRIPHTRRAGRRSAPRANSPPCRA